MRMAKHQVRSKDYRVDAILESNTLSHTTPHRPVSSRPRLLPNNSRTLSVDKYTDSPSRRYSQVQPSPSPLPVSQYQRQLRDSLAKYTQEHSSSHLKYSQKVVPSRMTRMQNLYFNCLNLCNKALLVHKKDQPLQRKGTSQQNSKQNTSYRERTLPLPRRMAQLQQRDSVNLAGDKFSFKGGREIIKRNMQTLKHKSTQQENKDISRVGQLLARKRFIKKQETILQRQQDKIKAQLQDIQEYERERLKNI